MYDSSKIHLQECKYTSASVQGASVSLWSKSSCHHKAYSSQIWFQRCFCCCINPLFVLNLTYPHSCSYPPTTPLFGERVEAHVENWPDPSRVRTLGWSPWCGLTLPPNLKRCSVFICDWRENVGSFRLGRSLASLIEACALLSHGYTQTWDVCAFEYETGFLSPKWLI